MKKIGLALGGGGAKGFAHIPILEVFDELGIKPYCITGTSIGAIMGALYASGHSAKDIFNLVHQLLVAPKKSTLKDMFRNSDTFKFLELIDPNFSLRPKGLLKGEKLLGFLYNHMQVSSFEELEIPLKTVATDFWRKEPVVFDRGELLPALRASMAIPCIFTPVMMGEKVLVDGGLVNNVPHDLLNDECDIRIAVDIKGDRSTPKNKIPNPMEALFHTYDVMMDATVKEKRVNHSVDIYLHPPLVDIDILDFHKAEIIYEQGVKAKDDFKRRLEPLLSEKPPHMNWFWEK